jgi:hypothetical protein
LLGVLTSSGLSCDLAGSLLTCIAVAMDKPPLTHFVTITSLESGTGSDNSDRQCYIYLQPFKPDLVMVLALTRIGGMTVSRQLKPSPAPRRRDFEQLMCLAIARRVLVKLAYQGDSNERLFEPIAVYISREEKACVSGVEIASPDKALAKPEPRDFEVGLIRVLLLTSDPFVVNADLDVRSAKYTNGIICAIEER